MVHLLENKTSGALWEIDGIVLRLRRRTCIGDELVKETIQQYQDILSTESYLRTPNILQEIASILGCVAIVRIGMEVYQDRFLRMFGHFVERYVERWAQSEECFVTNKVSAKPIFNFMFCDDSDKALYSIILREVPRGRKLFQDAFADRFSAFWIKELERKVRAKERLEPVVERIGILYTTEFLGRLPEGLLSDYLTSFAQLFTAQRKIIIIKDWYSKIFGSKRHMSNPRLHPSFVKLAKCVFQREYEIQREKFTTENHLQFDVTQDKWILFHKNGPGITQQVIDFSKIHSPSLRLEVKYFIKYRYFALSANQDQSIYILPDAINLLTHNNCDIHFFSDVDDVDVRALYMSMERLCGQSAGGKSVVSIFRIFSMLSALMEYLMSDRRDKDMRSPVPHSNPFARYKFRNANDYAVRTLVIPETVAEQIDTHLDELEPTYALLYRIFSNTGMRAKEVAFLDEDCLMPSRYDGLTQLKFKQYKTLVSRRKSGQADCHIVLIPQSLADDISIHIYNCAQLRKELGVPYIFVNEHKGFQSGMLNRNGYCHAINQMIEKHNICDETGTCWHFTSMQQRKTIAVTLIENGATVDELAYWLGHLSRTTASKYYAEVRKMRLANLNTAFFQNKFDLLISEEQLVEYSEEERKLLYMDFCLEQRRVELGFCLKKYANGGCDSRNSLYNCVNCKNLCTGIKYLPYWKELLEGQQTVVKELRNIYDVAEITIYEGFKEYKQAIYLLSCYENIVNAVERGSNHEFPAIPTR